MNYLYNVAFEELSKKLEIAVEAMKTFVEQEDYDDFFETFGEIYTKLNNEYIYAIINKTEDIDRLYNLIFDHLIPDSVDIMKESWTV